jgi:hypothetical protein
LAIVGRFPREWKVGFEIKSGGKWRFPSGMEYVEGLKQRRQVEVPFGNGVCGGFKIAAASGGSLREWSMWWV